MRHIHRAAVTGLFALWLAPLSAQPAAPPAGEAAALPEVRSTMPGERRGTDDRAAGDEDAKAMR